MVSYTRDDYDVILMVINDKDRLTKEAAIESAGMIKMVAEVYVDSRLSMYMEGFDDDPRELWEIPEAQQYIEWFATEMHRLGLPPNFAKRLDESSLRWGALMEPWRYAGRTNKWL